MAQMDGRNLAIRHGIGRLLIGAGALIVAWCVVERVRADAYQRLSVRTVSNLDTTETGTNSAASAPLTPGDAIGVLEIPRIGVSGAVVHGDTDGLLRVAIGHLPDTPLPWDAGNTALAGHRDTFFRALRHVRPDDEVWLRTIRGEFAYRVRQTRVVDPAEVSVLDPTPVPTLTLITCYPFTYVGPAPQRFIVRAERIDTPTVLARSRTREFR